MLFALHVHFVNSSVPIQPLIIFKMKTINIQNEGKEFDLKTFTLLVPQNLKFGLRSL